MNRALLNKQHCLFGAGLIGCYLGGVLKSLGASVLLVGRPTLKEKLKSGLHLSDYKNNQSTVSKLNVLTNNQLADDDTCLEIIDFLWLTVKCTGIEQAILDLSTLVSKDTVIFCCQNGLGSDAAVKQAFPDNLVLRVMVPFNVVELSTGHLHRGSQGNMTIEYTDNSFEMVASLVADMHSTLLPMDTTANMDALLWAKLQLNLGNSVNALADVPVKAMLEQRDYRKVIALLMSELLQVADALGINLPKITTLSAHKIPMVLKMPNFIFTRVANKMLEIDPNVRSSMWWDVSQGKATEIEHINGAILKHAKALNIECPANEKISALVRQLNTKTDINLEQKPAIAARTLFQWVSDR